MSVRDILAVQSQDKVYVEDVFSTYLYSGNGAAQTITNGLDLLNKGGLVWIKNRATSGTSEHWLNHSKSTPVNSWAKIDILFSNNNSGRFYSGATINTFTTSGFNIATGSYDINSSGSNYTSWSFRKQPKFFDIVTYTGDGTSTQAINHSLGVKPTCIIAKRTDTTGDWGVNFIFPSLVYPNDHFGMSFNSTGVARPPNNGTTWLNSTSFNPKYLATANSNIGDLNIAGATYVAYVFASDAGGFGDTGSDSIISCGVYTGNGLAAGPSVTLGWEPQFLMIKNTTGVGGWQMIDNLRGMTVGGTDATLQANSQAAETSVDYVSPTATGFNVTSTSSEVNTSGATYVYMAIRRPMKAPTKGNEVFFPTTFVNLQYSNYPYVFNGFDLVIGKSRADTTNSFRFTDRLRGFNPDSTSLKAMNLYSASNAAEVGETNPISIGDTQNSLKTGLTQPAINYLFKRAKGFFDIVCYKGNGVAGATINHNLGVAPELIIVKCRDQSTRSWIVGSSNIGFTGGNSVLFLEQNLPVQGLNYWNISNPSSAGFSVGSSPYVNAASLNYVAYLFATCANVSKIGSYTGNGTSQTINCGFAAGARFILVKRTDAVGDWYVWDSQRGIVAANDPHLSLNTTAAEVTTDDSVDPASVGFTVNQVAGIDINVTAANYIYLAIA
jgi:hypothetical protein